MPREAGGHHTPGVTVTRSRAPFPRAPRGPRDSTSEVSQGPGPPRLRCGPLLGARGPRRGPQTKTRSLKSSPVGRRPKRPHPGRRKAPPVLGGARDQQRGRKSPRAPSQRRRPPRGERREEATSPSGHPEPRLGPPKPSGHGLGPEIFMRLQFEKNRRRAGDLELHPRTRKAGERVARPGHRSRVRPAKILWKPGPPVDLQATAAVSPSHGGPGDLCSLSFQSSRASAEKGRELHPLTRWPR